MTKYTVTCKNGKDVFVELVKADKVDFQGLEVLFLDEVVAGFQRDRLLSFIAEVADEPAKTDVASEPALSRYGD